MSITQGLGDPNNYDGYPQDGEQVNTPNLAAQSMVGSLDSRDMQR